MKSNDFKGFINLPYLNHCIKERMYTKNKMINFIIGRIITFH